MPEPSILTVADRTRTAWRGTGPRPVRIHLLVPAAPPPYPAILLSPGSGGCAADLAWIAEGLTAAGVLTATVEHHGNNAVDEPLPEGFSFWWERPADLRVALDYLAERFEIARAGVVGYSLGGYTAAALLGARIDRTKLRRLYAGEPILPVPPDRPDLPAQVARLLARYGPDELVRRATADHRDGRISAGVLLAPAISPVLDEATLAAIDRPVLVRWADADQIETEGHRYAAIPRSDAQAVRGSHLDFCGWNAEGAGLRAGLLPRIISFCSRPD